MRRKWKRFYCQFCNDIFPLLTLVIVVVAIGMTGCTSMMPNQGYDPAMTANQIKAIAADKNAAVVCSSVPTPMGAAKVVVVNLDQRTIDNGGISADSDCRVTINTQKQVNPPKEK